MIKDLLTVKHGSFHALGKNKSAPIRQVQQGTVVKENWHIAMRGKRTFPLTINHINPPINVNQMPQADALKESSVLHNSGKKKKKKKKKLRKTIWISSVSIQF